MIIDKFAKNQYTQKLTTGYYYQKIFEYSEKYQNSNTVGTTKCRK